MFVPIAINLGRVPQLPNGRHMLAGGIQIYIFNGKKHRDKGPAEIHPSGYQAWFQNGVKHRINGPAVMSPHPDGKLTEEYWIKGKFQRRIITKAKEVDVGS